MKNQKTISALSKIIGIKDNYIQYIDDKKKAIRYLTHADNNDKASYDIQDIKTNIDLSSYFNNLISDESIDIEMIIEFIEQDKQISYRALMRYVINLGIWSTYRRNYSIIKDILYEHNLLFTEFKK